MWYNGVWHSNTCICTLEEASAIIAPVVIYLWLSSSILKLLHVFYAVARAAALGLDYPGVHGAPDLSGHAHDEMHTGTLPFRAQPSHSYHNEMAHNEANMASYRQNQPAVRLLDDRVHKQAHTRSPVSTFLLSPGTYNQVQNEYASDQMLRQARAGPASSRKSSFEEVKHVAPLTPAAAPSQFDLVNWDPQGRNKPLLFVYNRHDLVGDGSAPNRHGVSLSGLPLPQSRGHGIYQRGPTGYGLGRRAPILGSSGFTKAEMMVQAPAVGKLKPIRIPGQLTQPLHRHLGLRQSVQGNPVLRHFKNS